MFICLPKVFVSAFKKALLDGTISPESLAKMTSEQRRNLFEKVVGKDYAREVNAQFESKLLLKNQQLGMIHWAEKVMGLDKRAKMDIISKIERLDKVLDPKSQEAFLEDLAAQKLGIGITFEEARGIADLSKNIEEAKSKMKEDYTFSSDAERLDYGSKVVNMMNYLEELKTTPISETLKGYVKSPVKAIPKMASDTAGIAKSLKASLDNSAIFRQGWKTLWTNPFVWMKNARKSFGDMAKELGGKSAMDGINADIFSRENFLNGKYKKEKLAVGTIEEAYPTHLPGKIPVFKRIYKASESAFTGFVYRQRADIFDLYNKIAEKSGVDTTGIGKVVNSLTGRGNLGAAERAANVVNNVFFSPRFLKSNIDLLTVHAFDRNISPFARKQAAVNLVKVVAGTAAVLTIANAIKPGSVEKDPRSSDFGKIRIGDTRFDVTGGMGSLITLAFRLTRNSSKSSTTGIVSDLNSGKFGSQTSMDVVYNFFENKLSPAGSIIKDILKKRDFNGNPITPQGEVSNLLTPMPVSTGIELWKNPNSANFVASMLADMLGISTNTYSYTDNWLDNPGVELTQFKEKIGEDEFKKVNEEYNNQVNEWIRKQLGNPDYLALDDDEKRDLVSAQKSKIKKAIFEQYNFQYKKASSAGSNNYPRQLK